MTVSNKSILIHQMGSLEGRSVLELEDESLSSPRMISIKTSSLDAAPRRYFCDVEEISCRCILRRAFNSIRIVLLSDKLNILVLCGPLAILVDKLTSHHVSQSLALPPFTKRISVSFPIHLIL